MCANNSIIACINGMHEAKLNAVYSGKGGGGKKGREGREGGRGGERERGVGGGRERRVGSWVVLSIFS